MRTTASFAGRLISRQFAAEMWRVFAGRLGEPTAAVAARRLGRWQRTVAATLGPASGVTLVHDVGARPLFHLLGFDVTMTARSTEALQVSVASAARTGPLALVVGLWSDRLEGLTRRAVIEAASRHARWAFCFNGRGIRLIDADRPFARRYLEFDLAATAADALGARLLWATLRSAAFDTRPHTGAATLADLVSASEAHARRVSDGLQHGVHTALAIVADRLRRGAARRRAPPASIVEDALTVVYRLLFLLFAEARALVPMWNRVYRDSYSIDALREACEQPAEAVGLWASLLAISRLAHHGCSTATLRVTAFNGRLFSPTSAPLVEQAEIDDATMTEVLRALTDAARSTPHARDGARVAYGDLDVEQLGTIYEHVLDFAPALEATLGSARGGAPGRGEPVTRRRSVVSARRKESGTFYTPRAMAEYLVRTTLTPLVREASSKAILRLRVLDPAMGSGAFLVAACRFLADAYQRALEREGALSPDEAPRVQNARLRRAIARHCLYGVDVNPVAVQLARLSLWLATLAADLPLTFLDHHLCVGDSLVGASIDDLTRGWSATRDRRARRARADTLTLPLFDTDAVSQLMQGVMPTRARLCDPDDSVDVVRDKEQALARSLTDGALSRWLSLADVWCARWFWADARGVPPATAWREVGDHLLRGSSALPARVPEGWVRHAAAVAAEHRFLHWGLQFPEVFVDEHGHQREDGGFDAVVSNPPWDMVRGDTREEGGRDESRRASSALGRFVRESGLYRGGGEGHLNRYQLFVARALSLARSRGRVGLIVPWGLAGDLASARLRRTLVERCDTDTLVAFDNSEALFPIHRSVRFVLVTTTTDASTGGIRCRLGERSLEGLERAGHASTRATTPPLVLTPAWLRRVSGEGLELPYVGDPRDVALLDRLHGRVPALSAPEGWSAAFGRELNATDDRGLFAPGGDGIPVVDGRHIVPFALVAGATDRVVAASQVPGLARRLPAILRPRLAYRDVASPTNRVTLIAAVLPPRVVSTHTLFCLRAPLALDAQYCLCALLNSLVANYLVRMRVTTHLTVALVGRLPVPRPARATVAFDALAACARELELVARAAPGVGRARNAAVCERSPAWARAQALAAHEYGLEEDELTHVLSTFPLVDEDARHAVFDAFCALRSGRRAPGLLKKPAS